jgi:hypothetical protein
MLDRIIYLFTLSIFMGWPAGIIYTSSLYKTCGGRSKKYLNDEAEENKKQLNLSELEMTSNIILIMLDLGSLVSALCTAIILVEYYPSFVDNWPS